MTTPTRSELMVELRDLQRDIDEASSHLFAYLKERYDSPMVDHRQCMVLSDGRRKLGAVLRFLHELGD